MRSSITAIWRICGLMRLRLSWSNSVSRGLALLSSLSRQMSRNTPTPSSLLLLFLSFSSPSFLLTSLHFTRSLHLPGGLSYLSESLFKSECGSVPRRGLRWAQIHKTLLLHPASHQRPFSLLFTRYRIIQKWSFDMIELVLFTTSFYKIRINKMIKYISRHFCSVRKPKVQKMCVSVVQ